MGISICCLGRDRQYLVKSLNHWPCNACKRFLAIRFKEANSSYSALHTFVYSEEEISDPFFFPFFQLFSQIFAKSVDFVSGVIQDQAVSSL